MAHKIYSQNVYDFILILYFILLIYVTDTIELRFIHKFLKNANMAYKSNRLKVYKHM